MPRTDYQVQVFRVDASHWVIQWWGQNKRAAEIAYRATCRENKEVRLVTIATLASQRK